MTKHHAQKLVRHFDKTALADISETLGDNFETIFAFALGQRIEMRRARSNVWESAPDSPDFDDAEIDFRVSPEDAKVAFYFVDSTGEVAAKTGDVPDDEPHRAIGNCFEKFEDAKAGAHLMRLAFRVGNASSARESIPLGILEELSKPHCCGEK